jgi:hypothetical protein
LASSHKPAGYNINMCRVALPEVKHAVFQEI